MGILLRFPCTFIVFFVITVYFLCGFTVKVQGKMEKYIPPATDSTGTKGLRNSPYIYIDIIYIIYNIYVYIYIYIIHLIYKIYLYTVYITYVYYIILLQIYYMLYTY